MTSNTSATNEPFAEANTSSSPNTSYLSPAPTSQVEPESESNFSFKEVFIFGGGLILTAVVTYFTTLIAVNSDISNNRESISLLNTNVTHLEGDLEGAVEDISKNEITSLEVIIIGERIKGLEKQIDTHIMSITK